MQGKILIVDGIATNRIVLKVKLAAAFYQVIQASSISEAIEKARLERPDLIIASLAMLEGDAENLCVHLKGCQTTKTTPILAINYSDGDEQRLAALKAGIQDVLRNPIDDTLLLGRVRSLIRARNSADEWQVKEEASCFLGMSEPAQEFVTCSHCMLVSDNQAQSTQWAAGLRGKLPYRLSHATTAGALRDASTKEVPDAFILVLPPDRDKALTTLRFISALRSDAGTRHAGLLVLQTATDTTLAATALDLGADDLMTDGFNAEELSLRLGTLINRKRHADRMRDTIRSGLIAAIYDPLTGLHNRRYAMPHLARIAETARTTKQSFAVMISDLDYFKHINDEYGHAAGDAVLKETAKRLRSIVRNADLVARIGGEEFLIAVPGADLGQAHLTAQRICKTISAVPFELPDAKTIDVTISIGIAVSDTGASGKSNISIRADDLLHCADQALYAAKNGGRNQVTCSRPAA